LVSTLTYHYKLNHTSSHVQVHPVSAAHWSHNLRAKEYSASALTVCNSRTFPLRSHWHQGSNQQITRRSQEHKEIHPPQISNNTTPFFHWPQSPKNNTIIPTPPANKASLSPPNLFVPPHLQHPPLCNKALKPSIIPPLLQPTTKVQTPQTPPQPTLQTIQNSPTPPPNPSTLPQKQTNHVHNHHPPKLQHRRHPIRSHLHLPHGRHCLLPHPRSYRCGHHRRVCSKVCDSKTTRPQGGRDGCWIWEWVVPECSG